MTSYNSYKTARDSNYAQQGFTIIELMVVVAISAVLLTLAVPSFDDSASKSAIRKGVNDLLSDLAYARSAAVTRSQPVSICPSDTSGAQACGTGGWNDGWLVFYDTNESGGLDSGEEVIRVGAAIGRRVTITLDNNVLFSSRGLNPAVSEFVLCKSGSDDDSYARSVLVNLGGLVRGSRDTDGDGIHNGGEGGGNLSCSP